MTVKLVSAVETRRRKMQEKDPRDQQHYLLKKFELFGYLFPIVLVVLFCEFDEHLVLFIGEFTLIERWIGIVCKLDHAF